MRTREVVLVAAFCVASLAFASASQVSLDQVRGRRPASHARPLHVEQSPDLDGVYIS